MPVHPPKAVVRDERRDPWKRLREKTGVRIISVARRRSGER